MLIVSILLLFSGSLWSQEDQPNLYHVDTIDDYHDGDIDEYHDVIDYHDELMMRSMSIMVMILILS